MALPSLFQPWSYIGGAMSDGGSVEATNASPEFESCAVIATAMAGAFRKDGLQRFFCPCAGI